MEIALTIVIISMCFLIGLFLWLIGWIFETGSQKCTSGYPGAHYLIQADLMEICLPAVS